MHFLFSLQQKLQNVIIFLMKEVYSAQQIKCDLNEIYRYLGYKKENGAYNVPSDIKDTICLCAQEMQKILKPQAVYEIFELKNQNGILNFGQYSLISKSLSRNLENCSKVVLFALTIGPLVDKLIQKYSRLDSAKAVICQATGAMFTETFADLFCKTLSQKYAPEGYSLHPRFSPGYGDVPLDTQKLFFSILSCTQKIALTLNDSLLMTPEKSITAFIGLEKILKD
jgi:cobalamin-dependent methionine synthase I